MPNRQIRDTIIRNYLNDKARMLTVCNANFGTDCRDPDEVLFNTLEGTFFSNLKNDLSCCFLQYFLLIAEHQSSPNENMPLRMFLYLAELIKKILAPDRRKLYRERLIKLPKPHCIVLYDGKAPAEDHRVMELADAFDGYEYSPRLRVDMYNIRYGSQNKLMEKSKPIRDYSFFMHLVEVNMSEGMSQDEAIASAVKYCVSHDIMADYLTEKEKEVLDMYGFEWNEEDAKAAYIEEGIERERVKQEQKQAEQEENRIISMLKDNFAPGVIAKYSPFSLARINELARLHGLA